ncbi:MAG: prolipoprotein diacylglyceryl transferase [Crocinitomicaceae bacterium]|nr:prolipoprotein diacylglyceryl transferase [Crocinitomicaceae bacterium]
MREFIFTFTNIVFVLENENQKSTIFNASEKLKEVILAIDWSVDSELIDGWKTPNLYGLLFVTGLIIGYFVVRKMFRREQIKEEILDKLVLYMVLATIIGARLGHVLFYGPYFDEIDAMGITIEEGYFSHPLSILKVWEGGLASHGGAFAILITLYFFSKKISKRPMMWILDRIVAPIAIAACFIRLGNLVNHEIVGDVSSVPWAFSFKYYYNDLIHQYDPTPRHPSQLYESISYMVLFLTLMFMYWKKNAWKKPGVMFGTFLILLFGARFFIEFSKIPQVGDRADWLLNTGQLLSIPFVIAGIYILLTSLKKPPVELTVPESEE